MSRGKTPVRIIDSNSFDFQHYKEQIEKIQKNYTGLEKYIQSVVIKPFLDKLLINHGDLSVIDVSTNSSYSKHDTSVYSGKSRVVDLLVARDYNHHNIENADIIEYIAVVEVKSPFLKEKIYNKAAIDVREIIKNYGYFEAPKIDKFIMTDGLSWHFFMKNQPNKDRTISLIQRVEEENILVVKEQKVIWKEGQKEEFDISDAIPTFPKYHLTKDPEDWGNLISYLYTFLTQ